jgi:hypothetical protein
MPFVTLNGKSEIGISSYQLSVIATLRVRSIRPIGRRSTNVRFHIYLASLFIVVALLFPRTKTLAHEGEGVRFALLQWAHGLLNGDADEVGEVLDASFSAAGWVRKHNKDDYLRVVREDTIRFGKVVLRHAEHKASEGKITVAPILLHPEQVPDPPSVVAVTLAKANGQWKILSIEPSDQRPPELLARSLPEHAILHPVTVRLSDGETGNPVGARVHVKDQQGEYWPPQGHMKNIATGWRKDVGGDVRVDGKTYAYVEAEFVVPVPEGDYEIQVIRGLEYEPAMARFSVRSEQIPDVEVRLKRWSNMRSEGWFSGDTHVHFIDPDEGMLEMEGEDLNVVNILATKWGELITNVEHFTGGPSPKSKPERILYVNEECRHGWLGHTNLLNLKHLVYPLTWGGPTEGVLGGFDFPPMAHQADKTHEQGGFVTWAHFPFPYGELAVDIALGKVDSIDLLTWGNALEEETDERPGIARTWYRFLNCGFKIPATAGTDKMLNTQVVGCPRVYVKATGDFSYDSWLRGIREGRTFVTTGPMLTFSVDGREAGQTLEATAGQRVSVRANVRSLTPVDHIEIICNGQVVASKANSDGKRDVTFETEVGVKGSSWIAARAYSEELLPYQVWYVLHMEGIPSLAHTSPVYVSVEGKPCRSSEDAAFFVNWCDRAVNWAKGEARFQKEEQRDEMVSLFEKARAVYAKQVELAQQP